MESHLIDTNTVIELLGDSLPPAQTMWLEKLIAQGKASLSVINQIELLGFDGSADEMSLLEEFVYRHQIFPLSESVIDQTIQLRRTHRIKVPDAIIAATSLTHDLTLVTRNTKDFAGIELLKIIDLHE